MFIMLVMNVRNGIINISVKICGIMSIFIGFKFSVCIVFIFLLVFIEFIFVVKVFLEWLVMRIVVSIMFNFFMILIVIDFMMKILVLMDWSVFVLIKVIMVLIKKVKRFMIGIVFIFVVFMWWIMDVKCSFFGEIMCWLSDIKICFISFVKCVVIM